jgi:Asp-tRNA(Asn)/Glu-tRNA(Gln) amidotransferase A subunit family amidase
LEPAVEQQFHAALRALHRAGFAVEMRPVPEIDAILGEQQRVGTLVGMEAWRRHRAHLERHRTAMDPRVALRLERGGAAGDEVYEALLGRRGRLAAASQEMFAGAMLVLPTVACTSPLLQPLLDDDDAYFAANARVLRNTMIANLLDWCAVSLPMGRDERGLWTGFMLCAGRGQDRALLEVARLLAPIILQ